jgi:Protein of unknown function (DUF2568)
MVKNLNLAVRFVLELVALGALAYWGVRKGSALSLKIALGLGLPVLAALFWASFVSPRARFGGSRGMRLSLGLIVFLLASAAWVSLGKVLVGLMYSAITILNTVLTYAFGPQPGETSS